MAHHAEPMDVDDIESDFDNKENTYHHSNVLPRTPCTEKGYEELDVSELNMKLRYSITPAASPMSKSMSHCLDNRYNASTDESHNNTVINENEKNLTRSLHSALNKTDSNSPKVLPLQSLPADLTADSSRNATILQPLVTKIDNKNNTITVSNESEIDNLLYPSSSSSMTHTPEATTPTKEIPKDGGSPIMRGLKSVLSMFRSSQSPIPPAEVENKAIDAVLIPTDVQLTDSNPQAMASTPINQRNKERSTSRKNSPHKESLVFNEDLEKELQWNDDSTIVFSTEKIPIHKLFFQDKPASSKPDNLQQPVSEDVNTSVEYMDVSYNDTSMRERSLNATGNKSTFIDIPESDGEFVDCETTIIQDECQTCNEDANSDKFDIKQQDSTEQVLTENNAVSEIPFLDTTVDILRLIDGSQIDANADETVKQLDFSTTDIVNQLSDLINASETVETNVSLDKHKVDLSNTEAPKLTDVLEQTLTEVQPKLFENLVTRSENTVFCENINSIIDAENVSIENNKVENFTLDITLSNTEAPKLTDVLEQTLTEVQPKLLENLVTRSENTVFSENISSITDAENVSIENNKVENVTLDITLPPGKIGSNIEPVLPVISSAPARVISTTDDHTSHTIKNNDNGKLEAVDEKSDGMPIHPLPCDIPLPNEDDFNEIAHNFDEENRQAQEILTETLPIVEIAQNTLLAALNKTTELSLETNLENNQSEKENPDISCQLSLLPSDVPLPDMDDNHSMKINSLLHETVTAPDPVQPQIALATNIDNVVNNIEAASPSENANDEKITQNIILDVPIVTETVENNEEVKMEVSYCEQLTENSPQNLVVDFPATAFSSVELDEMIKIADFPNQLQPKSIDSLPSKIELPEANTQEINIVSQENIVITEKHIESEICDPAPTIIMENNAFKENSGIVQSATNLELHENVETNLNVVEAITSSVVVPKTSLDSNSNNTKSSDVHINISHQINNVDTAHDSESINSVTSTTNVSFSEVSSLPLTLLVEKTDEVNTEATTPEALNITETSNNLCIKTGLDTTEDVKNVLQLEAEKDEEIVVSENSSPFVSISAEEEINVEIENDNLEDTVNSFSPKSPLPPLSPKIVSKGYNLNFDDLDAMNPFATKTKIRMSPPPGPSPNKLPEVEPVECQKFEKSVLFNNGKNEKRRKSVPEKRKPLKTKRTFNSTFDRTETSTSELVEAKNQKDASSPKKGVDVKQDNSHINDIAQTDIVTPVIDEVSPKATNLDETYQETDKEVNPHTKTTLPAESLGYNPDNTTKIVENVVMSESRKSTVTSDNTSSSEQSAYFSAVASSTECTESKNVFNLPEIDDKDFNPFATKSKVCQSPPPDLDMVNPFATKCKIKSSPESSFVITPNDVNTTVMVDTESEFKEAYHNLSNCSDSSRTSDEKDVTVQEIHTEDEDTIEGPFLEAEDSIEIDKIPELDDDKVDVDLNNINTRPNEDDTEAAEMFIDAEAFEFLMNQNNTDEVAYSGKESLFLKFDPLFARRVTSEGVAAALSEIKKRQSIPKRMPKPTPPKNEELMSFDELVAGPSDLNKTHAVQCDVEDTHDDMNVTVLSKPMMAVTPAVNPVFTPKKSLTPTRANRLSMTFTSPAMAVIDRLLSLSGNSPSAGLDTTVTHASRERTEADQALTQLRELLAEKEINVYNLRCESKELKNRLSTLEAQMKSLEVVSSERLQKINELTENLAEKTKMNRSMAAVVEEYERTIASLISETEQDKKRYAEERMQLIRERDEQTAHLTSMEVSFSDLHSKYEKSKQVIIGYKTNEEAYKNSTKEFEDNLAKMHSNYELLKQHATSKLNHANQELEKLNKAHESEVLKYNAMIKRKDLHITSLEESLAQKTKANEELTAICDELINKVG